MDRRHVSVDDDTAGESASEHLARSRRALLGLGTGLGVAAFASAFRPAGVSAANGDVVRMGRVNTSTSPTTFSNPNGTAFEAASASAQPTIYATAAIDTSGIAVSGVGWFGAGVQGTSTHGAGVRGESSSGAGVEGLSSNGPGVAAMSPSAPGVTAHSDADAGVRATSEQDAAVDARGPIALRAVGRVELSRSGRATVAVGSDNVKVTVPGGVTATSLGFANLRSNDERLSIRLVTPLPATGQLLIQLDKPVTTKAFLSWMVIG